MFFQLHYQDMTVLKVLACMWCLEGIPSLLMPISFLSEISSHLSYSTVLRLFFFRHDHPVEVSDTLCVGWKLFIPAASVKHQKLCKRLSLLRPPVHTLRISFLDMWGLQFKWGTEVWTCSSTSLIWGWRSVESDFAASSHLNVKLSAEGFWPLRLTGHRDL